MRNRREPKQIAKRAIIFGAIAFRSSLEVTTHSRVVELSQRLLPWLIEIGCGDEIDPIEREELETPIGGLSDSQMIDVRWAGEAAAVFCWMLRLQKNLEETTLADSTAFVQLLSILKPEAEDIIRSAQLRDLGEIESTCRQFVLIRSMLQEARIGPPASDIIRRANLQRLNEVGQVVTDEDVQIASDVLSRMTSEDRAKTAGLYFIRDLAALWFLTDRSRYYH